MEHMVMVETALSVTFLNNLAVDDLMGSQVDHDKVELIIEDCPVAMNSIMCNLHELRKMVKEYGNSLFLSREYRATEKCENFYNFLKEKP
jgi:hypothetical protein